MTHSKIAFNQEPLVLGVEDSLLDVLTGEAINRFPGFPEAHGNEFGSIPFGSPQHLGTAVSRRFLVALDAGLLDVAGIGGAIVSADRAAPDSCDQFLYSFQRLTARPPTGPRPSSCSAR